MGRVECLLNGPGDAAAIGDLVSIAASPIPNRLRLVATGPRQRRTRITLGGSAFRPYRGCRIGELREFPAEAVGVAGGKVDLVILAVEGERDGADVVLGTVEIVDEVNTGDQGHGNDDTPFGVVDGTGRSASRIARIRGCGTQSPLRHAVGCRERYCSTEHHDRQLTRGGSGNGGIVGGGRQSIRERTSAIINFALRTGWLELSPARTRPASKPDIRTFRRSSFVAAVVRRGGSWKERVSSHQSYHRPQPVEGAATVARSEFS